MSQHPPIVHGPYGEASTQPGQATTEDKVKSLDLGGTLPPELAAAFVAGTLTPAQLATLSPELQAAYKASTSETKKAEDPDVTRGRQAYVDIWGIDPPKGYIQSLVGQGMNPYEIRAHELSKLGPDGRPLAKTSNYWRDQQATYASVAAQVFARR